MVEDGLVVNDAKKSKRFCRVAQKKYGILDGAQEHV